MSDEQNPMDKVFGKKEKDPFVGVAGSIGFFACGVVCLFLVFGGGAAAWPAAFAVSALAVMGIFMAYFLSRKS